MVLREVGEHAHADLGARQAVLGQANRRRFDRTGCQALVGKLAEGPVQAHGVGRGHASGEQRGRNTHTQSTHYRTTSKRRQLIF